MIDKYIEFLIVIGLPVGVIGLCLAAYRLMTQ